MGYNSAFFLSFMITILGLAGLFLIAFAPLDWAVKDQKELETVRSFCSFMVFSALIGALVVGLYKATTLMVRHL